MRAKGAGKLRGERAVGVQKYKRFRPRKTVILGIIALDKRLELG